MKRPLGTRRLMELVWPMLVAVAVVGSSGPYNGPLPRATPLPDMNEWPDEDDFGSTRTCEGTPVPETSFAGFGECEGYFLIGGVSDPRIRTFVVSHEYVYLWLGTLESVATANAPQAGTIRVLAGDQRSSVARVERVQWLVPRSNVSSVPQREPSGVVAIPTQEIIRMLGPVDDALDVEVDLMPLTNPRVDPDERQNWAKASIESISVQRAAGSSPAAPALTVDEVIWMDGLSEVDAASKTAQIIVSFSQSVDLDATRFAELVQLRTGTQTASDLQRVAWSPGPDKRVWFGVVRGEHDIVRLTFDQRITTRQGSDGQRMVLSDDDAHVLAPRRTSEIPVVDFVTGAP